MEFEIILNEEKTTMEIATINIKPRAIFILHGLINVRFCCFQSIENSLLALDNII